jgi:hypothetical protein
MHGMQRMILIGLIVYIAWAASTIAAGPALGDDDQPDTFGKTDAEILAMGRSAWFDYYTAPERGGDSTAGMTQAYGLYADAAGRRNDALPQQHHAAELRKLLDDFGEQSIDLASNFTGGGTMWIPEYAAADCDVEDALYALLGGGAAPAPATTTGQVQRDFAKLEHAIRDEQANRDAAPYFKYGEARASLAALRADFKRIAALAATLDRAGSDQVLAFCHTWATTGLELGEEGD